MQIRQLEYFVAVAEQLNFTKAAKQFYISQAAMTMQIKALEEELGVALFERTNRRVSLTPAGCTFIEDARAIIKRAKDAADRAKQANTGLTGKLSLGFVKGFEKTNLSDLLFDFHVNFPNISLSFLRENVAEIYDAVLGGEIDLAINILYSYEAAEELKELDYLVIKEYPLLAVVPAAHPLSHRASIARSELKDYPLIDISQNEMRYKESATILGKFAEAGFMPKVEYVSDDIETSILAVASGLGYALLPSYITDSLSLREKVIAIPIEGEEHQLPIIAAWKKENSNPALKHFVEDCLKPALDKF